MLRHITVLYACTTGMYSISWVVQVGTVVPALNVGMYSPSPKVLVKHEKHSQNGRKCVCTYYYRVVTE